MNVAAPDPRIHTQAAIGFGRAADAYARGRPDYPAAAVQHLVQALDVGAGSRLVELGAGTGKFTAHLVATGAHVVAVEPVAAMRDRLRETLPQVEAIDGTAEAIPLPEASIDAVFAAQAFHWFDGKRAVRQIHRILKSGGGLGLIWNIRDASIPWVDRLSKILEQYESGVPHYSSLEWMSAFRDESFLTPLETRQFAHAQRLSPSDLYDRIASISFIAAMPEAERPGVLALIRELLESEPALRGKEQFEMPYQTHIYWCRKP